MHLFGDGFHIVPYLRILGYDLSRVVWTGSNFGGALKHEMPSLISIGADTMILRRALDHQCRLLEHILPRITSLDWVALLPRECHRLPLGWQNRQQLPFASKVMVPLDGDVREGVGLLGSPCWISAVGAVRQQV